MHFFKQNFGRHGDYTLKANSIDLAFMQAHNQQATNDEIVVCFIVPRKRFEATKFEMRTYDKITWKLKDP